VYYRSVLIKIIFVCCLALLPSAAGDAQAAAPKPENPQKPEEILEHWRRSTVALGQVYQDAAGTHFVTNGSAVIVSLDSHRACLLTAKHMLVNPDNGQITQQLWMRFPSVSGEDEKPLPLTLFFNGTNVWRSSDDGSDLAVIPLPNLASRTRVDAVDVTSFADPSNDVFQGATVVVLGYPQIVGEKFLTAPIARNGIIAWINPKDPSNEVFLVDANLYNGNSGGPVFRVRNGMDRYGNINLGGGLALLGIVSRGPLQTAPIVSADGIVYHENPITHVQNQEAAIVANVGGIGIIEPVSRARKLLESVFTNPPAIPPLLQPNK